MTDEHTLPGCATPAERRPWTPAERADSAVCAAVLGTGVYWWVWVSLGALMPSLMWGADGHLKAAALGWAFWLAATWLTVRVMLDAALFRHMAMGGKDGSLQDAAALDGALQRILKVRAPQHGAGQGVRTMADRTAGAMRLYRALVAVSVTHGLLLLCATLGGRVF